MAGYSHNLSKHVPHEQISSRYAESAQRAARLSADIQSALRDGKVKELKEVEGKWVTVER